MIGKPRVLLAEDEPNIAESLAFLLERAGFDVECRSDGDSALAAALEAPPRVFLVDIMLPGIDGLEVVRRLRAEPCGSSVKVLMLTAKGQARDRAEAEDTGADGFISKPFSNREVVDTVCRLAGIDRPGRTT